MLGWLIRTRRGDHRTRREWRGSAGIRSFRSMALEAAEAVLRRRPFQAAGGGDGEVSAGGPAQVFLAAERGRPVDPVVWGDEERMKRELMVWAKAVASMEAAGKNTPFSSPSPSMRRKV